MNVAKVIRGWRSDERLSLRQAADCIGIDYNALWRLEKGESVNQGTLITIWRWLLQ
jgi:transcriptional regulator with XRE-family HTH domain